MASLFYKKRIIGVIVIRTKWSILSRTLAVFTTNRREIVLSSNK